MKSSIDSVLVLCFYIYICTCMPIRQSVSRSFYVCTKLIDWFSLLWNFCQNQIGNKTYFFIKSDFRCESFIAIITNLLCASNSNGIFGIINILISSNNMKLEWNSTEGKQQKPHVLDISSFNLNKLRSHILNSFILFYKPKTSQLSRKYSSLYKLIRLYAYTRLHKRNSIKSCWSNGV